MKRTHIIILTIILVGFFNSCQRKKRTPEPHIIGRLVVDLNANEFVVRKREALIGNMIADAIKMDYENNGKLIDFTLVNGGSIRFNTSKRLDGIYKAGNFTTEMVNEMLPFGNTNVIVRITGKQLKEVFERSVAKYPMTKGNFMQLSKEVKVLIDTTQAAQVLNIDETEIVSAGNRIVSIKINIVEFDNLALYSVGVSDFTAEGNDGYTTLRKLSSRLKEYTGEDMANVLNEYVIINSVIEPKLEGRILFQ